MRKGEKATDEMKKKFSDAAKKAGTGKWGKGKKRPLFSKEWINNLSISHKGQNSGKNSVHWIKDRTQLKKSERKDKDVQYIYWAKEVKNRDNWKCRLLSSDCKGRLESHHIFKWKDYPELRYVITNGITLCQFHHPRKCEEEKRMIPIFQELLSVSKELN